MFLTYLNSLVVRKTVKLGGADGTRTRDLLRDRQMVILGKADGYSSLT